MEMLMKTNKMTLETKLKVKDTKIDREEEELVIELRESRDLILVNIHINISLIINFNIAKRGSKLTINLDISK